MKPYPSTMRDRKRYIAFEVYSDKNIDENSMRKALNQGILDFIGIKGSADASYQFIEYNEKSKKGRIKCNHYGLENIKQSLTAIGEISFNKAFVHIIKIAGTVKKTRDIIER